MNTLLGKLKTLSSLAFVIVAVQGVAVEAAAASEVEVRQSILPLSESLSPLADSLDIKDILTDLAQNQGSGQSAPRGNGNGGGVPGGAR